MKQLLALTPGCFYDYIHRVTGLIIEKESCEIITRFIRKVVFFSQKTGHDIEDCIARYESDLQNFTNYSLKASAEIAKTLIIQSWQEPATKKQGIGRYAPFLRSQSIGRQEKEAA